MNEDPLDRFIYAISHDLQEPVRKINSFTRLLMREVEAPSAKAAQYADYVTDAADRLQKMIAALLFISRLGRTDGPRVEQDPAIVIEQVWRGLDKPDDARLRVDALANVVAESRTWARMWHELLDNAIKFRDPARPLRVRVTAEEADGGVRFCMEDNGIGMGPEPERGFRLFQALHGRGQYSGVGAGLAIVEAIVHHHGGTLSATSDAAGSRLFITWPRNAA